MKQASLEDVITSMAGRLGSRAANDGTGEPADDILSEVESYKGFDPVLAGLHKEYLDARAVYARLHRERGAGDPMADVAADRLESCLGAFETRLIELRQNQVMKQDALARLKTMREETELRDEESRRVNRLYRRMREEFYEEEILDEIASVRREGDRDLRMLAMLLMTFDAKDFARRRQRRAMIAFTRASALEQDGMLAKAS